MIFRSRIRLITFIHTAASHRASALTAILAVGENHYRLAALRMRFNVPSAPFGADGTHLLTLC